MEPLSLYLALYRYLEGHGATVQFPGTQRNYLHTYTDVSPDTIARSEIYLSITKPEEAHGEAFNIADTDKPGSWGAKWSSICEYFGLKGGDPDNTGWKDIDQWWYDHLNDYERMCNEYGLEKREISPTTWNLVKIGHTLIDRNREFSLDKIRNLGFTETYAVGFSYFRVFESLERKKAIPPRDAMCMR